MIRWSKDELAKIIDEAQSAGRAVVKPQAVPAFAAARSLRFALYREFSARSITDLSVSLVGATVIVWRPEAPKIELINTNEQGEA